MARQANAVISLPDCRGAAWSRCSSNWAAIWCWLASGCFQNEVAPQFSGKDVRDVRGLARKLTAQAYPLSQFLWTRLSESARQETRDYVARIGKNTSLNEALALEKQLHATLLQEFNGIVAEDSLYEPSRFANITLSPRTQQLHRGKSRRARRTCGLTGCCWRDAYPQ